MKLIISDYPHGYAGWKEVVMLLRRNGADRIVKKAIMRGELKPASSQNCVDCGNQASCYDHRDYNKPLDVAAVCKRCDRIRGMGKPYIHVGTAEYNEYLEKAKLWYNKNLNKNTKSSKEKRKYIKLIQGRPDSALFQSRL